MQGFLTTIMHRLAQPNLGDLIGGSPENIDLGSFGSVLATVTQWMIGLSGSVALIYLIYGGIQYLTAGGTDKTKEGKETITWSLIGLVVIIFAYALVTFLSDRFIIVSK